jgi:hypothetical protein
MCKVAVAVDGIGADEKELAEFVVVVDGGGRTDFRRGNNINI